MIISASRRTDIPKFFAGWFIQRVREGFFEARNPFNPRDVRRVSLDPRDVDAIVFWSKDPEPMIPYLQELDARGYVYYFQYTLNDYPLVVEPGIPPLAKRLDTFRRLAEKVGPSRVVWRYDPIIVTTKMPPEYHLEKMNRIARILAGFTDRLTISFLDLYAKVRPRLAAVTDHIGDPVDVCEDQHRDALVAFASEIARLGREYNLGTTTCGERVDLSSTGLFPGACVDVNLVRSLRRRGLTSQKKFRKDPGQRRHCLCSESRDVGAYNTCSHGCIYCYANYGWSSVGRNLRRHRQDSPFLIG